MRVAHESRAGELLNQCYELHEKIRSTAESEVYRATDRKHHRAVQVELLRAEHALKPSVVARFVRTPKQLLGSPPSNMPRVLAVETDDTGIPFVVVEDLSVAPLHVPATPLHVPATPLRTLAWKSESRELPLIAPGDASEIWGPNEEDFDEALDALFDASTEAERASASVEPEYEPPSTKPEPESKLPSMKAEPGRGFARAAPTWVASPTDADLEFDFESTTDPADVDTDPIDDHPPFAALDLAAVPDLAALPAIVARETASTRAAAPHAVAKSPAPVPSPHAIAHAVRSATPAPVVQAAHAPASAPAPSKKPAAVAGKPKARPNAIGTKAPTAPAASAAAHTRARSSMPSGAAVWFAGQSARAPARVVGTALATARASLFPPSATPAPAAKETRRMRKVARRGDRSFWGALGSFVFLLFAVALVFAVPLLADPTREKARVLLGARAQVAAAAFAAITIVSLVRTWALQLNLRPPMLRPVTTTLKPLTLLICLLCATYFLPDGALGPVERTARALLPWIASAFYLFLALHGLVLAAREAASSVLYALVLALLHVGGFYGSFQVLAVTVLDKQGPTASGAEPAGFFERLTGRGHVTGTGPDTSVAPPEIPHGTQPGGTEAERSEADELGIDELQQGRKQQQKQMGKLHNEVERMTQ